MCLYMPHGEMPRKATKDIVVFKDMFRERDEKDKTKAKKWKSMHFTYEYEKGYHYSNDNFPTGCKRLIYGEGLHSFSLQALNDKVVHRMGKLTDLVECVIPKGAMYFINTSSGCLASSDLVIVGSITQSRREKLLKLSKKQSV